MRNNHVATRYIRLATKERPADRFLTAQIREAKAGDDDGGKGDLYFVVEIHNPWFPNSQIGQTIINTVVREYRRGDSTSVLTNFELALRKTNTVLSQITQTGETDWIGNLSSLIMLVADGHVYLAQTGRANAYLIRGGRISEITEGLEDEASQHPLTTYTNITSGTLETGDRIVLASSQFGETISGRDLKDLFGEPVLGEAARECVRFLQQNRSRRVNGFILEANPPADVESETLYCDESLNSVTEVFNRTLHRTLKPALANSAALISHHAAIAARWTRDWLIPRTIDWSQRTSKSLSKTGTRLAKQAEPLLTKATSRIQEKLPKQLGMPAKQAHEQLEDEPLVGKTIYRVHHYQEGGRAPKGSTPAISPSLEKLSSVMSEWTTKLPAMPTVRIRLGKLQLSRRQLGLLGIALVVVFVVIFSSLNRRTEQVAQVKQASAVDALEQAKAAQFEAERAFILGQKETAKNEYVKAISLAQEANANASTQAEAAAVITASQTVLDQMISAQRLELPTSPMTTLEDRVVRLGLTAEQVLAATATQIYTSELADEAGGGASVSASATINDAPAGQTVIGANWFLTAESDKLIRYSTSDKTAQLVEATNGWKPTTALASFGTSLYGLDQQAGQIWKYTTSAASVGEAKAYLKEVDPTALALATHIAIDGDVFLLINDGSVRKYSKGVPVQDWKIAGIPTPWDQIINPIGIFADPNAPTIYLVENNSDDRPARILLFSKQGAFERQILLPADLTITQVAVDPKAQTALVASDNKLYRFDLTSAGTQ